MNNLIVPIDFSEISLNALQVAKDIASLSKGTITLIHGFEDPRYSDIQYDPNRQERSMKIIETRLDKMVKSSMESGIKMKRRILDNTFIWEMNKIKGIADADIIVMGSHGINGVNELFVGSKTQKVAQFARCPVLAIKRSYPEFKPSTIVFASDFNEAESHRAFFKIHQFAKLFNSAIHLMKVNTPAHFESTKASLDNIESFIKDHKIENYNIDIINANSPEEGILYYADKVGADLISIATHGRTGFAHLLNGSIAEHLINHSHKPVMTINLKV